MPSGDTDAGYLGDLRELRRLPGMRVGGCGKRLELLAAGLRAPRQFARSDPGCFAHAGAPRVPGERSELADFN